MAFPQPLDRSEFEIAIICALQLEYDAVSLLFDENYNAEGDYYGRARGDTNSYATGRIGKYNTVLALLTEPGIINAASTTANVLVSYNGIRLALLVGICGGVPEGGPKGQMLLGDVVVSSSIVQYGSGKQYPQGFASKRDMAGDSSGQPNKDIRTLIKTLGTVYNLKALKARTAVLLRELQDKSRRDDLDVSYTYPGTSEDVLFPSSYRHKHHHLHALRCDCAKTHKDTDRVCDNALISTCVQLGCQRRRALPRPRLQERGKLETLGDPAAQNPAICFGAVASSDTVMKSAQHRDAIAAKTSVIAFEMEGAGVWVGVPCLVVKGVSDYADSHKGDKWQHFAAATAAAAAKAILEWYPRTDRASSWSSISSSSSPLSIFGGDQVNGDKFSGNKTVGDTIHGNKYTN
ncbi:phosphorylase superfamily protein [Cladorrhinum sp. PSN332]|nr:phosphorylase superfamily protein [Cladorrhinum sp. PSN332]